MYTTIVSIIFAIVVSFYLLLWAAALVYSGKHLVRLQKFVKYARLLMFAVALLLVIALAVDDLLFRNIQIHTYF